MVCPLTICKYIGICLHFCGILVNVQEVGEPAHMHNAACDLESTKLLLSESEATAVTTELGA